MRKELPISNSSLREEMQTGIMPVVQHNLRINITGTFLPRDAVLVRYTLWLCVNPSARLTVRPSVTSRSSITMAKRSIPQTTSQGI